MTTTTNAAYAAYVLPFALFLVGGYVEGLEPLAAYYPWAYGTKIAAVVGALWWGRRHYPRWQGHGLVLGVVAGVVGGGLWLLLSAFDPLAPLLAALPDGLRPGTRAGFDPFTAITDPAGRAAFLAVRLAGLIVVVPLMEELFWRGFLARFLLDNDFQQVPLGKFTPTTFAVVTLCFVAVHPEITAALVWGAGINLLLLRTRNLWSCVLAHAASNLVLGVYILATGAWTLW